MGNSRNRKRKAVRTPPSKMAKKSKHGGNDDANPGPSAKKISHQTRSIGSNFNNLHTAKEGTVFMDLSLLFGVFDEFLKCPDCESSVESHVDLRKRKGYAHYILLQCKNKECEWKYSFHTSKKQGCSHEVNVRAVLAFREIGRGQAAMVTFNKVMNMAPPPTCRSFTLIQNGKLLPVVEQLANDSMLSNAMHVKEENGAPECGISLDGTWQKRGHASHNGVVTAISLQTKKCLDMEVLSDRCQQCAKWKNRTSDPKYNEWKAGHQCKINHEGSASSMETSGAVRIFERSFVTRGLKYKDMLGDGDSSTYNAVVERKPYGEECIPKKLECIGHIQKRVGSRLRKLKNTKKGAKLAVGKGLRRKGRLTDGKIDILQNYYGLSVRGNFQDVRGRAK